MIFPEISEKLAKIFFLHFFRNKKKTKFLKMKKFLLKKKNAISLLLLKIHLL
jgi:hypothetical protein